MADKQLNKTHRWRFNRLGGFDQVVIGSGDDIQNLAGLDKKLWAALSCPTRGIEFDTHTLDLLDTDGDGRIRVPEVLAATQWVCSVLRDPGDLLAPHTEMPLSAIDDTTEEGICLLASARQILLNLGKPGAETIGPADTTDKARIFADTRFNGDGVVAPIHAGTPALQQAMDDIIASVGSVVDCSGLAGVDENLCDTFFAAAADYQAWWSEAEADAARILPLGEATAAAADVVDSVSAKIDDYFTRTRLAGFDAQAAGPLNPAESDYMALAGSTLSCDTQALAALPLAHIEADRDLPLVHGVNPAWATALGAFRDQVVRPLFGEVESLSEAAWMDIRARFSAHSAWQASIRGDAVAGLGLTRVRELTADGKIEQAIRGLIHEDRALESKSNAIDAVDRLVHYYLHLDQLLHNFVSLRDFYTPGQRAVFQAGTLYLDGRSCDLCVVVDDIAVHSALATLSRTYLAYCACRRRGGEEQMTIAAAFTGGDPDNLRVGRNGVFYDRSGADWDATIVKTIEHPISVGEAFWSPYKRIGRMVSEQIEKFAGERDKAVDAGAVQGLADTSAAAQAGKAAPTPFDIGKFAGIFAAIGLAVGAIGTALASVLTGFLGLTIWQMPLAVLGLVLVISGPSMLIALLKLRQRNLGPILDANGWAVNTQAKINIPFGASLTGTSALPKGAQRSLRDPFAEKKRPWRFYLFLLVLLMVLGWLWDQGHISQWWETLQTTVEEATGADEATATDAAAAPPAEPGE